jgi:hypothetical protein
LFRVDADDRLTGRLMVLDVLIEVAELGIPVRVLLPFEGLGVGLQAEPGLPQQPAHRRRRDRMRR